VDEAALRSLVPAVIGILVRRGADFAAAEDVVQESLLEALRGWGAGSPDDPKAWLVTVAWRKFLDAEAAAAAANLAERDHLTRQAARINAEMRG
jgi:predicted RNA polymerase sigma factor